MADTTIRCSEETADRLYQRKHRKESYEDVIVRLLDVVESTPDVDRVALEREVQALDWNACAYAKSDRRVEIVVEAAAELVRRQWAAPYALRKVVERDVDGAADEDVQRILSDMLGELSQVDRPTNQIYEWVG